MNNKTRAGVHTSDSNPSLRPISNRTESTRSTASRVTGYRHALLKSGTQRQKSIEKDLPIPPILTQGDPTPTSEQGNKTPSPQTPANVDSQQGQALSPHAYASSQRQEETTSPAPGSGKGSPGDVTIKQPDQHLANATGDEICFPQDGHNHFHSWRLPVSKVRPAVLDVEPNESVDIVDENSTADTEQPKEPYSVEGPFHNGHTDTPKVGSFTPGSLQPKRPHEGHGRVSKVQFYPGGSAPSQPGVVSTPDTVGEVPSRDKGETQKAATYWGFLPRFGDSRNKQRQVSDKQEDPKVIAGSPGERRTSPGDSRKSSTGAQLSNVESQSELENRLQEGETTDFASPAAGLPHSPLVPALLQTAGWLRGLLRRSETDDTPNLTKLPERSSPQRRSVSGDVASQVTTYSDKNAADKKAMNDVMHGLEHILSEALILANEATGQHRRVGHLDDANLPLTPTSDVSIRTASVHESISSGVSEQRGDRIVSTPSGVTIGGVSNRNDQHEAPHKIEKHLGRTRFTKGDRRRLSSSSHQKVIRYCLGKRAGRHDRDDDCVLPMPPPDRQLKRYSVHSGPHGYDEDEINGAIKLRSGEVPNSREVREYIRIFHQPPISIRNSSKSPQRAEEPAADYENDRSLAHRLSEIQRLDMSACSLDGGTSDEVIDFSTQYKYNFGEMKEGKNVNNDKDKKSSFMGFRKPSGRSKGGRSPVKETGKRRRENQKTPSTRHLHELQNVSLRNKSHVSISDGQRFSLTKSARRQPTIARD